MQRPWGRQEASTFRAVPDHHQAKVHELGLRRDQELYLFCESFRMDEEWLDPRNVRVESRVVTDTVTSIY